MYVYIYIYIYTIHVSIYLYIYIYIHTSYLRPLTDTTPGISGSIIPEKTIQQVPGSFLKHPTILHVKHRKQT